MRNGKDEQGSGKAMAENGDDRDFVNSLARGLEVIRSFTRARPRMTLSEVAAETDLPRAAVRRFLLTLVREGYAATDGKLFQLRPKVLELGFSVIASLSIVEVAQPVMADVSARLNESCSVAVLDGDEIVYVARSNAKRVVNIAATIGGRLPAYVTSMGRVLLAAQDDAALDAYLARISPEKLNTRTVTSRVKLRDAILEARQKGWSLVDQELEPGLCSIAVPLRDRAGRTLAALAIGAPSGRVDAATMRERFLPVLQEAAQQMALAMPE